MLVEYLNNPERFQKEAGILQNYIMVDFNIRKNTGEILKLYRNLIK